MNKRGIFEEVVIFLILIALVLGVLIVLTIIIDGDGEERCKNECSEYDAVFADYEPSGHRNEECWCKKGGEPLRIW